MVFLYICVILQVFFFISKILLWFFIGSTTVSSSPGISNFFRTISKKEFIADSAKNQSITVVKALVHQSMSSEGNRISASQTASIETKTTSASNSISQQTTLIESDNSKSSKKRKRRGSKYVRRSDEIDVIQILTDNEDEQPREVEKHSELIIFSKTKQQFFCRKVWIKIIIIFSKQSGRQRWPVYREGVRNFVLPDYVRFSQFY